MTWNKKQSLERIRVAADSTSKIEVLDFTRDRTFENIPIDQAYRVDAVHLYADVLNIGELTDTDKTEIERSHKRVLRFLNIYQRIAHLIFTRTDAKKIDFQNQRLHLIIFKPYSSERARIEYAVAVAHLLQRVLSQANLFHEELPDVSLAVGIESGVSLAVSNGTRGDREPLFLGNPANHAAKLLGRSPGIYLGAAARGVLGNDWVATNPAETPLSRKEVDSCVDAAGVGVDVDNLIEHWKDEIAASPLSDIEFSRPTPPLRTLSLDELTPGNSKRSEMISIYADVDGFTSFVANAIQTKTEPSALQILHVIRKELRDVLSDFGGRKVRYIGDCLHGVIAEGTSQTTDAEKSVASGVLAAAAMHDSFRLIQEALPLSKSLGLAIGLDLGPVSLTRLGVKSSRNRCAVGLAVGRSEDAQKRAGANGVCVEQTALASASAAVKEVFKTNPATGLTYNAVVLSLKSRNDNSSSVAAGALAAPGIVPARAYACSQ